MFLLELLPLPGVAPEPEPGLPILGRGIGFLALQPLSVFAPPVDPTMVEVALASINGDRLDGTAFMAGTTKIDGDPEDNDVPDVPVACLVRLYRDWDGRLVREMRSASATGAWRFERINGDFTYTAIAFDDVGHYRAVLASKVTPKPMP